MPEEKERITIGFKYIDQYGNKYNSETTTEVFYEFGDDELTTIGRQLNVFLKQISFPRHNDWILMEDLTEKELWALQDYLTDYREEKRNHPDED